MPKRSDIKKVLIIGSGPIIIGQACEFDYSGTQACKALRKLGYTIVLVNSNPATIMTDPGMADATYIEPLTLAAVTEIIKVERPDALLPNLGGQTGLNLSSELAAAGVLDKYNVKVIGVNVDAIKRGEDRQEFKNTMQSLGIDMPRSEIAYSVEEAEKIAERIGYPAIIRPAYTLAAPRRRGLQHRGAADHRQPGTVGQSRGTDSGRGIGARLGGAGAGSRSRRQGPEDHRLLHRERRCHGRAYRRLLLHRPDAHHRSRAAEETPKVLVRHRPGDRGYRRHEHPVRP
jgi:hypothetical protein